jgi:putative restriction endonuclease
MERLSGLRRAQIGGRRAPHKPLLLLWLFGRFAATGSALAPYAEAADPVSQLINEFGPPVTSPALERQRAAMPFVHLERELWELRDRSGDDIGPDVPERTRWLLDHGAVGQLRPEVTALLADSTTLAAAARLLLDQHFTPVLSEMICAAVNLDLAIL